MMTGSSLKHFRLKILLTGSSFHTKEKDELSFRLKASIARQLWRNEGLYEVLNTKDDAIKKALEVLKK